MKKNKVNDLSFFQKNQFDLEILSSLFSLFFNALGIYLIYRWGKLLMDADFQLKEALLGKTLAEIVGNNSELLVALISLYIGFKILMLFIAAADWQQYLIYAKKQQEKLLKKSGMLS